MIKNPSLLSHQIEIISVSFVFPAEIPPFCHKQGCSCPTGYELIESEENIICRLTDPSADPQPGEDEEERCMCS